MYFTVNTAFVNYLDQIDKLMETLEVPILKNRTTFEQTLPLSLKASKFNFDLLMTPKILKDVIHQYRHKKQIFELEERHVNTETNLPNKTFLSNNFKIDVFSVCYCYNFSIGCSFDNIFTMHVPAKFSFT